MKKFFLLVLVLLISVGLFAIKKIEETPMLNDVGPESTNPVITDEVGDLIYELDVETIASDSQLLGVEYDGTYVWVTGGGNGIDPNYLYKIDPVTGTLVSSYQQPAAASVWGIRDLAYVASEGKIYGGTETDFFSFDIASETWTLEFGSSFGTIRALAYDGSHFWTKSFSDPIYEFDVNGTVINTYTDTNSAYGMAFDSFADCLWLFAEPTTFFQYDLNGAATGTSYTVTLGNAGVIGGAFYYEGGLVPGKTILGCLGQGMPDVVYGMELRDAAAVNSPAAPTDVTVIPGANGIYQAEITWTCPTTTIGGTTLTDLDEMRVYRDGTLVFTDTSPTIGGTGFHIDSSMLASGTYTYGVVGFNDAGEGVIVEIAVWVGEDAPAAVDNLVLTQTSPGVLSGTLTWDNPTTGLHGGACNNAIGGYHIERNDGVLFEVAGSATSFIDDTIPLVGTYCYTVVPYNLIGDGGSATSNLVLIGVTGLLISEDFSGGVPPAGWYTDGMGQTNWGSSTGNNAGGTGIEMVFNWEPSFNGISRMCTMTMDTSDLTEIAVEFKHCVDDYDGGYTLGVATSSDGINWNDVWTVIPTGAIGPETINVDITTADVGSATFQMCFYLNGDSYGINYWYIDDVMLTSAEIPTLDPPTNLAVDEDGLFTWDAPGGGGDIEELIYDNGVSNGQYSYVGYSMGTQMSPAEACQILELKIHTSSGSEFNAEVWDWDAGAPTEDLLHTESAYAVANDWVIVDVSDENLMVDNDFVVAFGSIDEYTYMSCNTNLNNGRSWDHNDNGGWTSWPEAYLIRAVVQYGDGTVAELSPTPVKKAGAHASTHEEKVFADMIDHNVTSSREFESFNVYLDDVMVGNTVDTEWMFSDLTSGQTYTAGVQAVYDDGESDIVTIEFTYMGTNAGNNIIAKTELTGNYPNPFNPETSIAFYVKEAGNVTLEVYNIKGQIVKTLVNDVKEAGEFTVTWSGIDNSNKPVSSGVYFYKMKSGRYTSTKKMILMK